MQDLWPIAVSVFSVFIVMAVGAICRRVGWLTQEADRTLANLTAKILLPSYFLHRILTSPEFDSPELQTATALFSPPIYGFVTTTLGFAIAFAFARVLGPFIGLNSDGKQRAFAISAGICNYGYIPYPLAEKFYPDAVIDLILHNVGVDLALWSVGILILSGAAGGGWKRALISPPLIAVLFASMVRYFGLHDEVPEPMLAAVGKLGGSAIPMGLLLSGAIIVDFISDADWKGSSGIVLSAIGIRQVLLPAMILAAATILAPSTDIRQVLVLQAAMPSAIFPIVLVRLYDKDSETALRVVLATSLAGIVLIPVWLTLGKWWLGV
jgi:hypothetical protein